MGWYDPPYNTPMSMKWVKGRKDYVCSKCGVKTPKGTIHYHEAGIISGYKINDRYCDKCGLIETNRKIESKQRLLQERETRLKQTKRTQQ